MRLAAREHGASSVSVADPGGRVIVAVGLKAQAAVARVALRSPNGGQAGSLLASATTADAYLRDVHRGTGLDAALLGDGGPVSSTIDFGDVELPASGQSRDVDSSDGTLRVAATDLGGADPLRLALFGPVEAKGFLSSRPLVVTALIVFFAVALLFVALLLRALGGQVGTMLGAARRIGEGDFSGEVPVVGNHEMAGLASEFNKMRERLAEQVTELRSQRDEIDRSVQRIGEAFASGLDRRALLEIVVERDVFVYLLGQAAASIETISLHELVSEQAVTDDLTGLSNQRRFRELLEKEAARAAVSATSFRC